MNEQELNRSILNSIKSEDNEQALKLLLSCNETLHKETMFGSWLHVAAGAGNLFIVKSLIENGISIDIVGGMYESTPLTEAAAEGHIEIVKLLLQNGATPDLRTSVTNPLISAVTGNHLAIVKLLIEYGVDKSIAYDTQATKGKTALMYAQERGFKEIESFLSGRDVDAVKKITEDKLSFEDLKAIDQAIKHAESLIKCNLNEPSQIIQEKLQSFIESYKNLNENDYISLGALWGYTITKETDWEWSKLNFDDESSLCIVDQDRKFLIFPLSFIKENKIEPLTLYNCITGNNLPNSDKNSFLLIS